MLGEFATLVPASKRVLDDVVLDAEILGEKELLSTVATEVSRKRLVGPAGNPYASCGECDRGA